METINPSDVGQLDFNSISFITLKNGNMIVIDGSVKAKNNSRKQKFNDDFTKQKRYKQQLSVSKHLTLFFKGKNLYNNNKNNFLIMKNDFNQISNPCKIVSFCYKGKSNNKMALKKIPNLTIDENIKYDSLFQNNTENYYKTNLINKKDIISNTKLESNIKKIIKKQINNTNENCAPIKRTKYFNNSGRLISPKKKQLYMSVYNNSSNVTGKIIKEKKNKINKSNIDKNKNGLNTNNKKGVKSLPKNVFRNTCDQNGLM